MFEQFSDLMTVDQLQEALQIGRNTAYELVQSGEIQSVRIGRRIRIPKRFVIDYILRTCYDGEVTDGCSGPTEVTL